MPPVTPSQFRLSEPTLTQLDCLARSAGSRTAAVREAVAYWHAIIHTAGYINSQEFAAEDWDILGTVDPPPPTKGDEHAIHLWGAYVSSVLLAWWDGREVMRHRRAEYEAVKKLAKKVEQLDLARGYALYCALRWLWVQEGTPKEWWLVDNWMGRSGLVMLLRPRV